MENISAWIKWVSENWDLIVKIYFIIVGAASAIVRLTPTLKDDNVILPIIKFLGKYVALNRSGDKEIREARKKNGNGGS